MDIRHMTIDDLLDVLQWMQDRAAYWRACNKPMPGTLYANDCKAEADAVRELARRGYMPSGLYPYQYSY